MTPAGIRALIDLAGAPLDPGDLRILGLPRAAGSAEAHAIDSMRPDAVHELRTATSLTILLGHLDEPAELAARIGLTASGDQAALARAALGHFGSDLPNIAVGEWSLLHYEGRELTLMSSLARRDPVYYVRRGALVAVAPSVHALAQLPWVGRAIDERGLLIAIGSYGLRNADFAASIVPKVRRLRPGASVVHSAALERDAQASETPILPMTKLTIDDAVEAAGEVLGRIVAQRLDRTQKAACLLSGGLDSTLVAWQLAQARGAGQTADFLCSVAPAGSGLADEWPAASAVAGALGLALHPVVPPDDSSPYRPDPANFASGHGPILGARHYLYEALANRALELGHTTLFDGVFGELTLTSIYPLATPALRLRQLARRVLGRGDPWDMPPLQSFVKVARHRLEPMAKLAAEASLRPDLPLRPLSRKAHWPRVPGDIMRSGLPSEMGPGGPRAEFVFRDSRLMRLFETFPAGFIEHRGLDRAPARLLLAGHVPENIRLRRKGMPFSPDYFQRLQRHAPAARARIPLWRRGGVDDWLDVEWLDAALQRVGERGANDQIDAQSVQLTAMVADFLLWWQGSES